MKSIQLSGCFVNKCFYIHFLNFKYTQFYSRTPIDKHSKVSLLASLCIYHDFGLLFYGSRRQIWLVAEGKAWNFAGYGYRFAYFDNISAGSLSVRLHPALIVYTCCENKLAKWHLRRRSSTIGKYKEDYHVEWPWVRKSSKGQYFAFCTVSSADVSVNIGRLQRHLLHGDSW